MSIFHKNTEVGRLEAVRFRRKPGERARALQRGSSATMKPRRLRGHKGAVTCCIASRTKPGIIVSSGEDGSICWFDLRCKDVSFTLDMGKEAISSICFKPGNEDVFYAAYGTEVKSFDLHMASLWNPLESYNFNKDEINQIALNSKASFLAAADDSGDVKIIDIQQRCLYKTLRGAHTSICSSVQFLPWTPWEVVTGGLDSKFVTWDFSRGRPYKVMDFGMHDTDHVDAYSNSGECFNPPFVHAIVVPGLDMVVRSEKVCAVGRGDGVVDIIDIESELSGVKGRKSSESRKESRSSSSGNLLPKGKRLQLDYTSGGHTAAVSCVAFSQFGEKGKFLVSGGNDAFVKIWDWSRHFDAAQNDSDCDILHLSINLSKKVNWLCTTPSDSENLIVCDTSRVMKVFTVS